MNPTLTAKQSPKAALKTRELLSILGSPRDHKRFQGIGFGFRVPKVPSRAQDLGLRVSGCQGTIKGGHWGPFGRF